MKGWIKIHRKILESRVFSNPELFKLFMLCLIKANHKKNYVHINGITDPIKVKPGQFITGRNALHREFYAIPANDEKGPRTIWRWMKRLENWGSISINSSSKYSLVTVANWEKYQNSTSTVQEVSQKPTKSSPQANHQSSTDNNDKRKVKNDKSEYARLKEFTFNLPPELKAIDDFLNNYRRWWKYLIITRDQTFNEFVVEEELNFLVKCQQKGHPPKKVISQSIRNKNKSLYQLREQTMHLNGGAKKLFTYAEVQKLREAGTYSEEDFKIRHDKKDGRGNPLRELISN
ncbi:hypothetical protein [Fodinibius salsisoli]|uniref:Uncharacterized protein n=1 Tax=Fodinibius salsisoli TaxID=2820877 RepID=A0ABT3PJ60_9BACT|nr:hypothetical protein [Fodinibius salsisoli]MCW9705219.1 hypothetical protein [Fodinibius salsisoli]